MVWSTYVTASRRRPPKVAHKLAKNAPINRVMNIHRVVQAATLAAVSAASLAFTLANSLFRYFIRVILAIPLHSTAASIFHKEDNLRFSGRHLNILIDIHNR